MNTELIIGESAFEQLASEWDALVARSMTNTPFQSLAYQKAWWTHLKPDGGYLFTITTRSDTGALLGIGCFYTVDGAIHFNGCVEETDYLDLICPAEHAQAVWRATFHCLLTLPEIDWSQIDLCNIPSASPSRAIFPALAAESGFQVMESVQEVCPVIQLPDTFDEYLESLDSKQRRELTRKLRRADGSEVQNTIVGIDDDLAIEVENFLELLQKSTYEKRDWLNPGRRALFHDVARAAQQSKSLQLIFTTIEENRAAALFNFDYDGRIWVYNSGLDPTAFAALSPGVVVTAKAIELAIQLGRHEFDFLRGNEDYKYRFGATDTFIYRLRMDRMS